MASTLSAVLVRQLHGLLEGLSECDLPDQSPSPCSLSVAYVAGAQESKERIGWLIVNCSGRQRLSAEKASPTREGLNTGLQIVRSGKKSVFLGFVQEYSHQRARTDLSTSTDVRAAMFIVRVQSTVLEALKQFRKARPVFITELIVFPVTLFSTVCRYPLGPAPPSSFSFPVSSTHLTPVLFFPHSCSLSSVLYPVYPLLCL